MKKNLILVSSSLLLGSGLSIAEKNYESYTGKKFITYGRPSLSNKCGMQQNNSLRMYPKRKLEDVALYASNSETAPKIQLKIYTKAPIGTKVELHLGKRGERVTNIHSVFYAYTTMQNCWEDLTFTFSHMPESSTVKTNEIDQLTLLFASNYSGMAINSMEG